LKSQGYNVFNAVGEGGKGFRITEAKRPLLLREYPAALREGHDESECLVGPADRCTRPGAFEEVLATLIGAMVEVYTDLP
jgi:hypothetical protein